MGIVTYICVISAARNGGEICVKQFKISLLFKKWGCKEYFEEVVDILALFLLVSERMNDLNKIKLLVMDVDGTLTDGKIYMGNNGEIFKAFDVKDGCAIHDILPSIKVDWDDFNKMKKLEPVIGIIPCIITGRKSEIINQRCRELGIVNIYQGYKNKIDALTILAEKYGIKLNDAGIYEEIAYIGDDIVDVPVIKKCGLTAAPADAVEEVLKIVDYVSQKRGGDGAVREFIEKKLL